LPPPFVFLASDNVITLTVAATCLTSYIKRHIIPSGICFLGFRQRNYLDSGSNLLDLVFTDFAYFSLDGTGKSITQLDQQYAITMNFTMPIKRSKPNFNTTFKTYSARK
jgi:hypothetical protein